MSPIHERILGRHHRIAGLVSRRFFWLLALLIAFLLLSGELPDTHHGRAMGGLALIGIFLMAVFGLPPPRRYLFALVLCSVPIITWIHYVMVSSNFSLSLCQYALLGCLLFVIYCTLEYVLTEGAISGEHILGAICGYILIAMFFATVYTLCWLGIPAAFAGVGPDCRRPWGDLLYFSFTTLSTVGYGDIAPVAPLARSAAMAEQLTGTFYLAVLIARLAGLYPPKKAEKDSGTPD